MRPRLRDPRLFWRAASDKIQCRVVGRDGRIHKFSTKCTSEAAASAFADRCERIATDDDYAAAATTTISDAANEYFRDLERRRRSEATKKIARQKVGHFGRIWGTELALAQINAPLVLEYIDRRQREGVTDFTISKELGQLRQILKIARYRGCFQVELDRVFPPYFSGGHVPRDRWPTPDEIEKLSAELEPRRFGHVLFIVAVGARLSESFRAGAEDIDLARNIVHLRGTKTLGARRDVPITDVNRWVLHEALKRAPGKRVLFHPWASLHRDLKAACQRAGIPALGPNDLRRGFARWHKLAGVDNHLISKLMGHTTDKLVQTTYANISGEEVGTLISRQLERAPDLLLATDESAESAQNATAKNENGSTKKEGAPETNRTSGLRFRKPTFTSVRDLAARRSSGTKLGLDRLRGGSAAPDLLPDGRAKTPGISKVPAWVGQAADALTALRLAACGGLT